MNNRNFLVLLGSVALLGNNSAYALNYFELEVYPYQTASQGEMELENFTAYTRRGTQNPPAPDNNKGMRNSLEATYGVTDKTEVAGYVDYSRARGNGEIGRAHV